MEVRRRFDALVVDVERVRRINTTLVLTPSELRHNSPLRPIELRLIAPSQRIDSIAERHVHNLPPTIRTLLGGQGASSKTDTAKGSALASHLLFESAFTRELIVLDSAHTQRECAEVCAFFGWTAPLAQIKPAEPAHPAA